ncbi:MAG TPA: hypothetical protein DDX92_12370 [Flavobacteriales bacterium]|jgi:Flp pilus assembly protein TadD|nr:hypothetical protein [Flavobacteriales bacterium]
MNNKPFNEGKVAYESGNLEEAIRMFTLALEIDPHHPDIYHDRAVAYLNLGKPNLAIIDLNHSVEYQPNNPYRYSSRAFARDAVGDIAGAIEDYKKAIQLDPHDAIAHNNLGLLEEKMGRIGNAELHYRMASEFQKELKENPQFVGSEDESNKPSFSTYARTVWEIFMNPAEWKEVFRFIKNGFK